MTEATQTIKKQFNNSQIGVICNDATVNIEYSSTLTQADRETMKQTIFALHYDEDARFKQLMTTYAKSSFIDKNGKPNCLYKTYNDDELLKMFQFTELLTVLRVEMQELRQQRKLGLFERVACYFKRASKDNNKK